MAINKYKIKAGIRYLANLYENGTRVAQRGGFLTKGDAKKWLAQQTVSPEQPLQIATAFRDLCGLYLDWVQPRRGKNTYIAKNGVIKRFLKAHKDITLEEIDRHVLTTYHQLLLANHNPKTANRHLLELSVLFNWLIKEGHAQSNPCRGIEKAREEQSVRYIPPAKDLAAVRMAATNAEREIIDTLYFTAARLSEILSLTWDDINFEKNAIRLWTNKRRGGNREPRVLAMHRELREIMQKRWTLRTDSPMVFTNEAGEKWSRHNPFIRDLFSRVCTRAKIKPFTAHAIRHHVASALSDSHKATQRQIQRFLGHMNLRTTEIYLHDLSVDDEILAAFPDDPIGDSLVKCSENHQ